MRKLRNKLLALLALSALSATANSTILTWDIVTNYKDLVGQITFDDTRITGLTDGDFDPADTHISNASLNLSSAILGIDYSNNDVLFQPLTNTFDNKHIDNDIILSDVLWLRFTAESDSGSPAVGISDYWLNVYEADAIYVTGQFLWAFTDDNGVNNGTNLVDVTEPSILALLGLGLVGVALSRRRNS